MACPNSTASDLPCEARRLTTTLAERVNELVAQHGSLRAAARVLMCDPGYLSRLQSGEKDEPGDLLRRRMGLRRIISYERVDSAAHGIATPSPAGAEALEAAPSEPLGHATKENGDCPHWCRACKVEAAERAGVAPAGGAAGVPPSDGGER